MVSILVLGCALGVAAAEPEAAKGPDLAAYHAANARAGRDADAHVALALWCEAHGMPAEKARHLARAVLLDPANAKARGLLGYVQHDGRWMRPDEVSKAVEESPEAQALFKEYQARRIKARDAADDQYKLAKWCDEHGLDQQATVHYHRVVELDSGREGAWRRLGFKKINGRWAKPEVVAARKAEHEAQAKADKYWRARLAELKDDLSGRNKAKQAEALEAVARIDDPRAVPMVWNVLALGEERWQRIALQIFSQIDAPRSSTALAMAAVFAPSAQLRSEASQVLLRRDPRDYAGPLIGLLRDEIEYKVRPVDGPGSQGELFIKGKDANLDRVYRPMRGPQVPPGWATLDDWGFPVVKGYLGQYTARRMSGSSIGGIDQPPAPDVTTAIALASQFPQFAPYLEKAGNSLQPAPMTHTTTNYSSVGGGLDPATRVIRTTGAAPSVSIADVVGNRTGGKGFDGLVRSGGLVYVPSRSYNEYTTTTLHDVSITIPVGWMMMQARESAAVAQQQLADDVQQLDAYNASVRGVNERARQLLKSASGRDEGPKAEPWRKWFVDFEGYAYRSKPAPQSEPPTIVQNVPINYQPFPVGDSMSDKVVDSRVNQNRVTTAASIERVHACFAAGTPVHTLRGGRPIEDLRAGDEVLTQNTSTGSFTYRPVLVAYHNPPNETYRLDLGGESVVATGIHRFWKAGHGWIMARDVKAGDRLRSVGGSVEVVSVTKDRVQPVFNLKIDGGDDYCVGGLGLIAHDNSLVDPVERPFDGVPALAAAPATTSDRP